MLMPLKRQQMFLGAGIPQTNRVIRGSRGERRTIGRKRNRTDSRVTREQGEFFSGINIVEPSTEATRDCYTRHRLILRLSSGQQSLIM